jgi:hypothetical protein
MIHSPIGWAEQGKDLVVERRQVQDEHGWTRGRGDGEAVDSLEALEDPAHGGAIGRLLDLVGDGLARGRELLAQAVLGQPIDQQAEHHHQTERDDALRFLQEDRGGQEERIFEEGKAVVPFVLFSQIITKVTIIVSLSICLSRWRFHLSSDQANYDTMCVNHRVMI